MLENEEQKELLELRKELAAQAKLEGRKRLFCSKAPPIRKCKKALELDAGEYTVTRYAETTFRNAPRTILFVSPMGEDGQQKTDEETPIWGAFLQEEIEIIGPLNRIEGRLYCRLGREKTNKEKKISCKCICVIKNSCT